MRDTQQPNRPLLRFSVTRLLAVTTAIAVYLGVLKAAAQLLNAGSPLLFSFWLTEFCRLPIYALWIGAALALFEYRYLHPLSTKCALLALLGFGCTSTFNAIFQLWFMVGANRALPWAGEFWVAWQLGESLLYAAWWAILLFALLRMMNCTKTGNSESASDSVPTSGK